MTPLITLIEITTFPSELVQLLPSGGEPHQLHADFPKFLLVLLDQGLAVRRLLLAVVEVAPALVLRGLNSSIIQLYGLSTQDHRFMSVWRLFFGGSC